jgi:hypothetical protein
MTAAPLSRASAVFPLVDHQTSVLERVVKARPRDLVEANLVRLARRDRLRHAADLHHLQPSPNSPKEHACPPQ